MNSAAELKRFNAGEALDKNKTKITQALEADAVGLSISQLMTVCQLSVKTVRHTLDELDVESQDGVYYLKNCAKTLPETKPQEIKPTVVIQEQIKEKPVTPTAKPLSLKKRLLQILESEEYKDVGITATKAMELLNITRILFDQNIFEIRKDQPVLLKNFGNGRVFILESHCPPVETTVKEIKPIQEVETPMVEEVKVLNNDPIANLKKLATVSTVKTTELVLTKAEILGVLKDVFDMQNAEFFDDGIVFSAVLTKAELVA